MYRIWFERGLPDGLAALIEGVAQPLAPTDPDDPIASAESADAIIASSGISYDRTVFERLPNLAVISRTGIGYDRIDVEAATEEGVVVCIAPDGPTVSTAEHTVALLLAVAKRLKEAEDAVRSRRPGYFMEHDAVELDGKVLGLVGLGRIGRRVAAAGAALGMRVVAHDPYASSWDPSAERLDSLEAVLEIADVVSLHVPLTADTRHLIGAEELALMRRGAFLINAARGPLVDHRALLEALEDGHLAGAGLDVAEPWPLPGDHPLLGRSDVVVTPHVAAATREGRARLYRMAVGNALDVLGGRRPDGVVNPEVWRRRRRSMVGSNES